MLSLVDLSRTVSLKLANMLSREQIHSINHAYPIVSFGQIRSLTFDRLTRGDLEEINDVLPLLPYLESLTISSDENEKPGTYSRLLYQLRHVKRLRLVALGGKSICWANIDIQRWSLDTDWAFRHLQINPLAFQHFALLLGHLPHLRSIETSVSLDNTAIPCLPNLHSCILYVSFNAFSELASFLRQCPNLTILELETSGSDAQDGHQWENLLREALSRLRHFKLVVDSIDNDQAQNRRDTFERQFWIQRATKVNSVQSRYEVAQDDIRTIHQMTIEFDY